MNRYSGSFTCTIALALTISLAVGVPIGFANSQPPDQPGISNSQAALPVPSGSNPTLDPPIEPPPPQPIALSPYAVGSAAVPLYVEYGNRLRASEQLSPLGSELFGDNVSLYTGQTHFSQVDIDIPGNSGLPVQLRRRYNINMLIPDQEHDSRGGLGNPYGGLSNWDIEVPSLHGTFDAGYLWNIPDGFSTQQPRCSYKFVPKLPDSMFERSAFWTGYMVSLPGQADREMLWQNTQNPQYPPLHFPSDGRLSTWTTSQFDAFSCPTMPSGWPNEGFKMTTREGITYTFDHMVTRVVPKVTLNNIDRPRMAVYLLASLVEDRFGNSVTYTYNSNGHPTSIESNDGRTITLDYAGGERLQSAWVTLSDPAETRTWNYGYGSNGLGGFWGLTSVTLPDGTSTWTFDYNSLNINNGAGYLFVSHSPPKQIKNACSRPEVNPQSSTVPFQGDYGLKMTHPSGAVGKFYFKLARQERDSRLNDMFNCVVYGGTGLRIYAIAPYTDTFALVSKTLSNSIGTGASTWTYNGPNITLPDGSRIEHDFSSTHEATNPLAPPGSFIEGQLEETRTYANATASIPLSTTTYDYFTGPDTHNNTPFTGQLFPSRFGILGGGDDSASGSFRPLKSVVTTQQGATFSRTNLTFDSLGRPLQVERKSTLPITNGPNTRTETTVYQDSTVKWLLDQVASITATPSGAVMQSSTYDANTMVPMTESRFGKLLRSMTYKTDGTLNTITTVKDSVNQTTTLGAFKRGIPTTVTYADSRSVSAIVDDAGDIRSATDENGFTTSYGYDTLRRLTSITRPSSDSVAWSPTTLQYNFVSSGGGVDGNHWMQTTLTGDARTVVHYDHRLRPRLTWQYDNAAQATTQRRTWQDYDYANRQTFVSYPGRTAPEMGGVASTYDALGRLTSTVADSEIANSNMGKLTTSVVYPQTEFVKEVTNPRGFVTTARYQAFDEPSEDAPTQIIEPGSTASDMVTTVISRDVFGKPKLMTRSGLFGNPAMTVSASRRYVYDPYQRLCKTIEPETGVTIVKYDDANNIDWRAPGQSLTNFGDPDECQQTTVIANQKIDYDYDQRNRLITTEYGDSSPTVSTSYTADGLPEWVTSDGSVWHYVYNKRRLLESEHLALAGASYLIQHTFNPNGHPASLIYPDNSSVAYAPNALGEPSQVGSYAYNVTRHPNGAIASFSYGNGVQHTTSQTTRDLPNVSRDWLGSTDFVHDTYSWDANANVQGIASTLMVGASRSMQYDARDRLIQTIYDKQFLPWNPTVPAQVDFDYDPLDNLRSYVTPSRDYTHEYDAANRLTRIRNTANTTMYSYGYAGTAGNRGVVTQRDQSSGFNIQNYTVGLDDRVRALGGSTALLYNYDGRGRRTRILSTTNTTAQVYSRAGQLLWTKNQEIGSFFGAPPEEITKYVYLGAHLIAREIYAAQPIPEDEAFNYIHTDGLGSPVAATTPSGSLAQNSRSLHEPYGLQVSGPNGQGPGYTGHVRDAATGLSYMQQRYYDPVAGRFLSPDPVATEPRNGANFNRYWYANNNPYGNVDPDGRFPFVAVAIYVATVATFSDYANAPAPGQEAISASPAEVVTAGLPPARAIGLVKMGVAATRAGRNGVQGPAKVETRTTRSGEPAAKVTYPDGSVKDVSSSRVKEFVPQTNPKAPADKMQRVKFDDAQAGSKGYKRDPTPDDLDDAGLQK